MASTLSLLHISDIHFGHARIANDWPRLQTVFLDDLKRNIENYGNIDVVLFTGDIAFSGKQSEYNDASLFLSKMWNDAGMKEYGTYFLSVPGNHDLLRTDDESDPIFVALKSAYHANQAVSDSIWNAKNSHYYTFIRDAFCNYANWDWASSLHKPTNYRKGHIPGDFTCTIVKGELKLGIVGLNSAFLQFYKGNAQNMLDISTRQLLTLTDENPDSWCRNHTFSILASHHGKEWLSSSSKDNFLSNIYTPDRFFCHFYGHMHNPYTLESSEGGSSPRRYRQGASLFGLEETEGGKIRKNGYCIYRLTLENTGTLKECMIPRKAGIVQNKEIKFAADSEYPLAGETIELTHTNFAHAIRPCQSPSENITIPPVNLERNGLARNIEDAVLDFFEYHMPTDSPHAAIRSGELEFGLSKLRRGRYIWINSEWGLGKEGFTDELLHRISNANTICKIKINCDDVDSTDTLLVETSKQTGIEFYELIINIPQETTTAIIFDNVSLEIIEKYFEKMNSIAKMIFDASPNVHTIFITRFQIPDQENNKLILKALDRRDTAAYIAKNQKWNKIRLDEDTIDVAFTRTNGIPMLIEHLVDQLRYVPIGDVTPLEKNLTKSSEPIPLALRTAIASLEAAEKHSKSRALLLLKTLSFLPSGERLKKIKYVTPKAPIHPPFITELDQLSLLEICHQPTLIFREGGNHIAKFESNEPILKVPRQIREYVLSTMTPRSKVEMLYKLFCLYFGENWKTGAIRTSSQNNLTRENDTDATELGNEYELLRQMISAANEEHDMSSSDSAINIILSYCEKLHNVDRYRDIITITKDLQSSISSTKPEIYAKIQLDRARSLRMLGRDEECIEAINEILETKNLKRNEDVAIAYINLAFAYQDIKNKEAAKEAAIACMEKTQNKSALYMQAKHTLIELEETDDQIKNSIAHKVECRKLGHTVTANNAALWLESRVDSPKTKLEYYQEVIDSKKDLYNQIRAAAAKISYIYESAPDFAHLVTNKDKDIVRYGYSLSFSQRMVANFQQCHIALWHIFESEHRTAELLRLFRYSSIIWRLDESKQTELKYCQSLKEHIDSNNHLTLTRTDNYDLEYLKSRMEDL